MLCHFRLRTTNGGIKENMSLVCGKPDVELTDRKKPPDHCKITHEKGDGTTIIKLEIKRVRKEGNSTLGTISDFRKYTCNASSGNDIGKIEVKLLGKIALFIEFVLF